jgi:hypothetical protein
MSVTGAHTDTFLTWNPIQLHCAQSTLKYVFVVYLTSVSIALTTQCRMIKWNWKKFWNEETVLGFARKKPWRTYEIRCPEQDSNRVHPQVLSLVPKCLVSTQRKSSDDDDDDDKSANRWIITTTSEYKLKLFAQWNIVRARWTSACVFVFLAVKLKQSWSSW